MGLHSFEVESFGLPELLSSFPHQLPLATLCATFFLFIFSFTYLVSLASYSITSSSPAPWDFFPPCKRIFLPRGRGMNYKCAWFSPPDLHISLSNGSAWSNLWHISIRVPENPIVSDVCSALFILPTFILMSLTSEFPSLSEANLLL